MKKIAFFGFMASILTASGAAFADDASLTTKGYVDRGLRVVYQTMDAAKADKTTVDTLSGTVNTLSDVITDETSGLESKASQASLDTLTQTVNGKADSATVTALQQQVNTLSGAVDGIEYTGQNGVTVTENDEIELAIPGDATSGSKYVYTVGTGWSPLSVEDTFPEEFDFDGE